MKVAIVDYGGGNAASVGRALAGLGVEPVRAANGAALAAAERAILPGVGHFGAVLGALEARRLRRPLLDWLSAGKPLLGICVGLQALYQGSEEAPGVAGLGVLPGQVARLRGAAKLPHVGWNTLDLRRPSRLLAGGETAAAFYFTHSYAAPLGPATTGVAHYPEPFTAVAEAENILGVQFHPEKSGAAGWRVLENFLAWPRVRPAAASVSAAPSRAPARRIIACLDVAAGRVVKGVGFRDLADSGDPAALAAAYNRQGADELVLLDIAASRESRPTLVATVRAVAERLWVPLTVGGGVRDASDAAALLAAGADKIAVNSAALARPALLDELAEACGSQAVVAALDARREGAGGWRLFTHGGTRDAGRDAVEWAREAAARGAGEILLTSMDRDGTKTGFDCELTAAVSRAVATPVIASGGGGGVEDFAAILTLGHADAALAASIFHRGEWTLADLKRGLRERGIAVRQS